MNNKEQGYPGYTKDKDREAEAAIQVAYTLKVATPDQLEGVMLHMMTKEEESTNFSSRTVKQHVEQDQGLH